MARKKKHPEHVNHERWLVSYADFITLLFAFFVVMFAVSQVDSKKVGRFSEAFSKAVGAELFVQGGASILPGDSTPPKPDEGGPGEGGLPSELEDLRAALAKMASDEGELQGLQVIVRNNELVLRLPESIFFASGEDAIKPPTGQVIDTIAPELVKRSVEVHVEGHTDAIPIRNSRTRSNWELSALRATGIVTRLVAKGVAGDRLSAIGFGDTRPIASNATPDGRKQNRRVDLIVSVLRPQKSTLEDTKPEGKESKATEGKPTEAKPAPEPPTKATDGSTEGAGAAKHGAPSHPSHDAETP